jgi:hypothetical protein
LGEGGIAPRILDLGIRYRGVVSFTLRGHNNNINIIKYIDLQIKYEA